MTRVELVRHVGADPAGVALLVAEPASWSAAGIADYLGHLWVVESPRRAADGFVAGVEVVEPLGRLVSGELLISPCCAAGSDIRLAVDVRDAVDADTIERDAACFVELLADRARARAFAA
jgi:hypothetical protein